MLAFFFIFSSNDFLQLSAVIQRTNKWILHYLLFLWWFCCFTELYSPKARSRSDSRCNSRYEGHWAPNWRFALQLYKQFTNRRGCAGSSRDLHSWVQNRRFSSTSPKASNVHSDFCVCATLTFFILEKRHALLCTFFQYPKFYADVATERCG